MLCPICQKPFEDEAICARCWTRYVALEKGPGWSFRPALAWAAKQARRHAARAKGAKP